MDKDIVKVSYLIPSYNHKDFILSCLESVRIDIEENCEIIIIDDGSTDGSHEIIQSWVDQFQKEQSISYYKQSNAGITKTLNRLITLAKGEYLRVVASDDELIPGSTKKMIDYLESKSGALMVFGDSIVIDENKSTLFPSTMDHRKESRSLYKKDLRRGLISKWCICGPVWVIKPELFNLIGIFNESLLVEDWDLYLRANVIDSLVFYDEKVAYYRLHGRNTSRTSNVQKRIRNLYSQLGAGFGNIERFSGIYRLLMKAEVWLLQSKIKYLEKCYLLAMCYFFLFCISRVFSYIFFKFDSFYKKQ